MIKKIDIMGIGLDNYTVRESMRQVENYLSNDVLNTIENISMQMLIGVRDGPGGTQRDLGAGSFRHWGEGDLKGGGCGQHAACAGDGAE